ncbi:MAG: 30S ribosome-binding factor RbfA [Bacteroidetes bacterium]|jgi:ribosome-binding factor A|nr:30S ribosome-binding factor RbfA [Bacteroidota bacterium]MBL0016680.1 30S ribosome-binding factor RbfA [Bacteroidota bacterium]MBP6641272.1 30S ribosome-binding factor RbfA [Bacteroidia bacterium]
MKESNRQKKFGKLLQKELSEVFQRDLHLEGEPMLTVTVVRASPDLRMARIFISVFPDEKGIAALAEVEKRYREIRSVLAQRIKTQVRYIPELQFFLDDTLNEVEKMEDLFGSLRKPNPEA